MSKVITVDEMSLDQLQKNVDRGVELVNELEALFPGLLLKTQDDRLHSTGRYRSEQEVEAHGAILDAVERFPAAFQGLANKDNGRDPKRFETELLRDRLKRRTILEKLAEKVTPLSLKISDTVLDQGELCKPVISAAYEIAKPLAEHDAAMRTALQPALDYNQKNGRKAAESRAANKAAAEAAAASKK